MHWLPNFFIAGAPKAGTSSVHQWIADHPDAAGSQEKETYFFADCGTHMYRPAAHVSQGFESWAQQFSHITVRPKVIVESTPGYMYYATAQTEIYKLPTRPKCLFILREPSAQIYSLYTYFRNNWDWIPANMDFAAYLETVRNRSHAFKGNELAQRALDNAAYVNFLRIWRDTLGPDRMMVRSFDELLDDEVAFTKSVANWIGLDPRFYDKYAFPKENETYTPKHRGLQSFNVAVRGLLPKGRLYDAARSIYRRVNTSSVRTPKSEREEQVMADLRAHFAPANAALAEEFNITFRTGG